MIEITSTNPMMSYIIEKNPNTQRTSNLAFERELRKGRLYGWFVDDQTFRMMFVDAKTESSFNKNQQFEYLDRTRYSSSYLPVAAISTMLAKAMKIRNEHDLSGYDSTFSCLIELSNYSLAQRMLRSMPEITLTPVEFNGKPCRDLFTMKVTTNKSINHMLNVVQIFCVMQAIEDANLWIDMREQDASKYVRSLNAIDAPYYLRYTLQAFGISSPDVFKKIMPELAGDKFVMHFGKTDEHRLNGILPELPGGDTLWDIGCGELKYVRKLCRNYSQIVAFDANPMIQEKNEFRLKNRGITNVELRGEVTPETFADFKPGTDILMTEVLEHMPKDDAMAILKTIAQLPFRHAIFTVPNKDFNVYYGFDEDDKRHSDHHYEPTQNEFSDMLIEAGYGNFSMQFPTISDVAQGIPSTICVKVTKT
jgi:2-polyprenyl-3-methyl-5-hydroxy-6-metoxy-1,4-benzoquinol methylase